MRILISNDDGIYAKGLWILAEALQPLGEVVIVAPDRDQSGVGTAISLHNPVRVTEVLPQTNHIKTYAVEGTPADAVILGLEWLVERPVDLVVSGINEGSNLGDDILVSGTVGAALQAYVRGINTIAISVTALKEVRFEVATAVAELLVRYFKEAGDGNPVFLNVNVPNVFPEQIQGVEVTRTTRRSYVDAVQEGHDGKRKYFWITRQRASEEQPEEGTDRWAIQQKRISLTPLHVAWTDTSALERLRPLAQSIGQGLPTFFPPSQLVQKDIRQ
jgi:5'-nucleotidase